MTPVELVLERLRDRDGNPRSSGSGWQAKCPAHEDRQPSLHVEEGSEACALLNCHAGCTTEAVVEALGLTMADLFVPKPKASVEALSYAYTDEQGTVLYRKIRKPGKKFHFDPKLDGKRRVIYNLHAVREAVEKGRWVVIVEGEKDADRLAREGITATTLSAGAESPWLSDYEEQFAGATQVVIIPDNDGPGRKYGNKIANGLRVVPRWLELDGLPDKGDVSDWLDKGHDVAELKQAIKDAPEWAPVAVPDVDGAKLLDEVAHQIRRFVVTGPEQIDTLALWVVHTHALDAFYTTGRLYISSPEAECGKSRLLDVLELLVPNPINTTGISPAAMYRLLLIETPVLLLDEIDKTIGRKGAVDSETTGLLLAILNSGYRRGKWIVRCVGVKSEPTKFPTFAPVAMAGITSTFDQPFMSRSIPIDLERRMEDDPIEALELDYDVEQEFEQLRNRIADWAGSRVEMFRQSQPERPEGLEDRKAECWVPLLKIAQAADGWLERAHAACEALTLHEPPAGGTAAFELLADLRDCFYEDEEFVPTALLIERLHALEESDWRAYNHGRGLNAKTVGKLLGKYGIDSVRERHDGEQHRGYLVEGKLMTAWKRYVEQHTTHTPQKGQAPSLFDSFTHVARESDTDPSVPATAPSVPDEVASVPHEDVLGPDTYVAQGVDLLAQHLTVVAQEDVYPAQSDPHVARPEVSGSGTDTGVGA